MSSISRSQVVMIALAALFLLTTCSATTISLDNLEPRFGQTIVLVHQAESAGATSSEVAELVMLLNKAVETREKAFRLVSPSDAQKRAELLAQVDELLTRAEFKATRLQAVASQRTLTNRVLAYVSGVVAALIGTLAYAYAISFWRKYHVRRTFHMKISPK